MKSQPACYGKMFPDLSKTLLNRWLEGQAFKVLVEGSGMGIHGRTVSVKPEAWQQCAACPAYRQCYDLSLATLLLHGVTQRYGLDRAL